MDRSLAARKKSLATLILVVGVAVVAVGTFVLSQTGLKFIFNENASSKQSTYTLSGKLMAINGSACKSTIPSQFAGAPYVLEGNFPTIILPQPAGDPKARKTTSFVGVVEAAKNPNPPTLTKPANQNAVRPTPQSNRLVPTPTATPVDYSYMRTCLPVYADSAIADPLVKSQVNVTGIVTNGAMYAKSISAISQAIPATTPRTPGGSIAPAARMGAGGGNVVVSPPTPTPKP